MCGLIMVSLGNASGSLVVVMAEERQSGGGSVHLVYFICFFQGTLQMEGKKKRSEEFFLPALYLPSTRSYICTCHVHG